MRFRVALVKIQRLSSGLSGLWPGGLGSDKPIVLIDVVGTEGAISQGIVGIDGNCLIEIAEAFVEAIFGELRGVMLALQIELIRFGVFC
jgi:hypothetical protein